MVKYYGTRPVNNVLVQLLVRLPYIQLIILCLHPHLSLNSMASSSVVSSYWLLSSNSLRAPCGPEQSQTGTEYAASRRV